MTLPSALSSIIIESSSAILIKETFPYPINSTFFILSSNSSLLEAKTLQELTRLQAKLTKHQLFNMPLA